jgi:hypothetical protein
VCGRCLLVGVLTVSGGDINCGQADEIQWRMRLFDSAAHFFITVLNCMLAVWIACFRCTVVVIVLHCLRSIVVECLYSDGN